MDDHEMLKKLIANGRYEESNALANLFRLEQEERQTNALAIIASRIDFINQTLDAIGAYLLDPDNLNDGGPLFHQALAVDRVAARIEKLQDALERHWNLE